MFPVDLKVPEAEKFAIDWRSSGHDTDFSALNFVTMIDMLTDAINKAGSTDPLKVALALEDMPVARRICSGRKPSCARRTISS